MTEPGSIDKRALEEPGHEKDRRPALPSRSPLPRGSRRSRERRRSRSPQSSHRRRDRSREGARGSNQGGREKKRSPRSEEHSRRSGETSRRRSPVRPRSPLGPPPPRREAHQRWTGPIPAYRPAPQWDYERPEPENKGVKKRKQQALLREFKAWRKRQGRRR